MYMTTVKHGAGLVIVCTGWLMAVIAELVVWRDD